MPYEEPIYDDSSEVANIETIYDQQIEISKLRAENSRLRKVLTAAIRLTDFEWSVVETAIEAVYFPGADTERQRQVARLLDGLFAEVKDYRAHKTVTAAEYLAMNRKPIVLYTRREGSYFAGQKARVGNAVQVPGEWVQNGRSVQLINADTGNKIFVSPEEVLEVE